MSELETGALIQQTFEYVTQVFEETAYLMKDLQAALKKQGYKALTGNSNGSNGSRHLDWPRQWLPRYVSSYWVQEKGPEKGASCTYLAAAVLFGDLADRFVEPVLVYGLIRAMEHEQAGYQYGWLWDVYFNRDEAFENRSVGEGVAFSNVGYDKGAYAWAHSGVFYARGLASIGGSGDVDEVAAQLIGLWES